MVKTLTIIVLFIQKYLSFCYRSTFTRVQRLCCCLAILYLTMISNCMWFRDDEEQSEDDKDTTQSAFTIGPISITTRQLYISVVSSAMVVPPILLITSLFGKSGEKPEKAKDDKYSIKAKGAIEREGQSGNSKKWPYWCVYIAYVIVVVAVTTSAFFTILYAFQWGKEKSEKWLVTFLLSFFESVVFIQPLKVSFANNQITNSQWHSRHLSYKFK